MAGMMAAGASAGAMFGPWGAAIGGVAGAAADMMGSGGSAPPPPSSLAATSGVYGSGLSADAWNVNFSGSTLNADTRTGSRDMNGNTSASAQTGPTTVPPTYIAPMGGNGLDDPAQQRAIVAGDYYGLPWYVWALGLGVVVLWKSRK